MYISQIPLSEKKKIKKRKPDVIYTYNLTDTTSGGHQWNFVKKGYRNRVNLNTVI